MQTPSNNEITINNLRLLGYDLQDANKAFRLNLDSLSAESLSNPKLLVHIINFLLYKTVDQQSIDSHFKQLYPPRTQLEQTLYKQEVAEYLKNSRMVPRNFITSKTIIENKSLRFLRFLSEFALRNQFLQLFPQKQLKTVYTDPQKILQDDRISINDIGDIFSPASYQFEVFNKDSLNMPIQLIQMMNQICIQRTMVESKKLKKILKMNCQFLDEVQKITNLVSDTIKTERDKSLKLQQQIQSLKNIIKPQYLSQERKLDRKPQIDQSIKVFQGIQNIINQFYEFKMDYGITNIQSTPRLDRFDQENNLNTIVNQYNQNLEATEEQIDKIESQTWIQERALKTLNNSRLTVQNIKKLRDSIKIQ